MSMAAALKRFNDSIDRNLKAMTREDTATYIKWISFEALRRVIMKTPVDTGRARGNWHIGINAPGRGPDDVDKGGGGAVSRGARALAFLPPFPTVFISNNLPYIEALEDGHSRKQAPSGMVKVTIEELEKLLR